jgi:NTE family protein
MFSDKTIHNIQMSKAITYHLKLIDDLYDMLKGHLRSENKDEIEKFEKFVQDIKKFQKNMEQKLKGVYYITRDEPFPSLHENADFSIHMIKASIKDGE